MKKILLFILLLAPMVLAAQTTQRYYCALFMNYDIDNNSLNNKPHKIVCVMTGEDDPQFYGVINISQGVVFEHVHDICLHDSKGSHVNNILKGAEILSSHGWILHTILPDVYVWFFYKDASSPVEAYKGIHRGDK